MYRFNFENLNALQEQFNHLVEEAYGRPGRYHRQQEDTPWMPPAEVWETDKDICLSLDLPGISSDSLDLQIEGEQLTIRGERKPSEEQKNYKRREKVYGQFYRAFNLTTPIEREKVSASYKNGILEVVLPKSEAVKPKQIRVSVEE